MPTKKRSLPSPDWQDILKALPTDMLAVKQKRKLALTRRVIDSRQVAE